jgi:methyl-accepting chemotaxis protein
MSATSEELAAQAEELQASIAFFKVDNAATKGAGAKKVAVKAATKVVSAPPASRKSAPAAHAPVHAPVHAGNTVAAQQARAKGFALDLSMGGPDAGDAEFRESA